MSLGDTIIHCGLVGLSFCRSWVSFLFLAWLLQPPPCSVYAGYCPLMGLCLVVWWSEPALDTGRAPLLCGCCCAGRHRVYSLAVRIEALRSVSELHFWSTVWGRQDRSTPTGRGVTEGSSAEAVYSWVCSVVSPYTHCAAFQSTLEIYTEYFVLWHCPQSHLNHG